MGTIKLYLIKFYIVKILSFCDPVPITTILVILASCGIYEYMMIRIPMLCVSTIVP